jgi:hypothetical protein
VEELGFVEIVLGWGEQGPPVSQLGIKFEHVIDLPSRRLQANTEALRVPAFSQGIRSTMWSEFPGATFFYAVGLTA